MNNLKTLRQNQIKTQLEEELETLQQINANLQDVLRLGSNLDKEISISAVMETNKLLIDLYQKQLDKLKKENSHE